MPYQDKDKMRAASRRWWNDKGNRERVNAKLRLRYRDYPDYRQKTKDSAKKYHQENPEKIIGYKLQRNYGITLEEYNRMLKQQRGRCAVCSSKKTNHRTRTRFFVDHDHQTGKVRGLLCHKCNTGLGHFDHDLEKMAAAMAYIQMSREVPSV
jgi:hypothetical protein